MSERTQTDKKDGMGTVYQFFLSAHTPNGYDTIQNHLVDRNGQSRRYILKGSSGPGKTLLMEQAATHYLERGHDVFYFPCPLNPDSLDAVLVPDLGLSLVDSTAPHVVEPALLGVTDSFVNLGDLFDEHMLRKERQRLTELSDAMSRGYATSYRYIRASGILYDDIQAAALPGFLHEKAAAFCKRFLKKHLRGVSGLSVGKETQLFLSGVTPKGIVSHAQRLLENCEQRFIVQDKCRTAGLLVSMLKDRLLAAGVSLYSFYCPLAPDTYCEHLFVPEKSLCILTSNSSHPLEAADAEWINMSRFVEKECLRPCRVRIRFDRKAADAMLEEAVRHLGEVRECHREFTGIYARAMDTERLELLEEELLKKIIDDCPDL